MTIDEQITLYPELTGEERATVEAYVAAHPELKPALDEAKQWDRLLNDVRLLGQEPSGDEALAYYVVTRSLQAERAPEAIASLIRRIEERIKIDPSLAIRVAEMESRLQAAEEGSPASEQFERLMKSHRSAAGAGFDSARPKPADRSVETEPVEKYDGTHSDERDGRGRASKRPRSRAPSSFRGIAAALIALIALYVVLYIAGILARPSHERLAVFSDQELTLEGYENVRGDVSADAPGAPIGVYLEALTHLRSAQTSFVGLFPTFREASLDSAATLLNEVIRSEPAESFLAGEAAFLLGKTELARGNVEAAEQALRHVISSGGRKAPDARRMLAEISS